MYIFTCLPIVPLRGRAHCEFQWLETCKTDKGECISLWYFRIYWEYIENILGILSEYVYKRNTSLACGHGKFHDSLLLLFRTSWKMSNSTVICFVIIPIMQTSVKSTRIESLSKNNNCVTSLSKIFLGRPLDGNTGKIGNYWPPVYHMK